MEFDRFRDSYRSTLEDTVAFSGAEVDLFTEVKARALVDLARRSLPGGGRLRALDVGCGPGETDRFLEGAFGELVGADASKAMIEAAAKQNPWASYRHTPEGEPLPFEDASFDLSFAICVFHHVPSAEQADFLAEIARVTRPGGLVAIFEHNPLNPLTRKVVRDCPFDEDVELLRMRDTRALLSAGGLELEEARYILFFPRRSEPLRRIERGLRRLPLGAQYYVAARTPGRTVNPNRS